MTKIKAVFFDVDGTLFSFKDHAEPQSTRQAVRKLRTAGIMPILATGRPTYQFNGLDLEPFETFITLNGQLCFSGNRKPRRCTSYCRAHAGWLASYLVYGAREVLRF